MERSSSIRLPAYRDRPPTQAAMAAWRVEGLPDWGAIWAGCVRRVRAWRIPPRWSAGEWSEEVQAQGVAAAWQAVRDYDPARGVLLGAFVHRRVLFAVRARYREEWAYSLHFVSDLPAEGREGPSDTASSAPLAYEALRDPLARLSKADRRLIERLFWRGLSETELAGELGISQSTVSRRKRAIILSLRRSFGDYGETIW
jgi:RNA polymerase sigma-70 factor (ECF subfamily)